jgi:hypothetical protein
MGGIQSMRGALSVVMVLTILLHVHDQGPAAGVAGDGGCNTQLHLVLVLDSTTNRIAIQVCGSAQEA